MNKILLAVSLVFFSLSTFAYEPPASGEFVLHDVCDEDVLAKIPRGYGKLKDLDEFKTCKTVDQKRAAMTVLRYFEEQHTWNVNAQLNLLANDFELIHEAIGIII